MQIVFTLAELTHTVKYVVYQVLIYTMKVHFIW